MAFQPCPGIIQVEMQYFAEGQFAENVYHVSNTDPHDLTVLINIAAAFQAWETAHGAGARTTTTFLERIVLTDLATETSPRLDVPVSPPIEGTAGGASLPNNVTLAIKWTTGLRGRSNRGRTFLVGMADSALSSDKQGVTSTYAGNIVNAYQALITGVNGVAATKLVVLSRRNGGAERPAGIGVEILAAELADPFLDSQRRRLPAHNRHH